MSEGNKPQYVAEKDREALLFAYRKNPLRPENHVKEFTCSGPKAIGIVLLSLCCCHYASQNPLKGAFGITYDTNLVSMYKGLCAPILSYTLKIKVLPGRGSISPTTYSDPKNNYFILVMCPVILH